MIHFKTYISKIDWCIECFITTDNSQLEEIMFKLENIGCSKHTTKRARQILSEQYDSGFAYSNLNERKSIMVINKSTSMEEFVNTYNHEKNHIEMHICEALGFDPYGEVAADLSGCLAQRLFNTMLISMKEYY